MNRIAAQAFLSLPLAGSEASKLALEVGERKRAGWKIHARYWIRFDATNRPHPTVPALST
jgi:hypothetical protein